MITESIIKEAQAGSSEAFAIIYNETVKTAYYVAKRILLDDDATEDVLQESYIAVFKNLSNYQTGNLQGWIDTIVANRAKNYLRTKNPILFSEMETEENPVVEFEEEKIEFRPDEKVDYSETQRLILEIVDNLSPEQRLAVMLFYFEERSVKEIAQICECSENTVKSRLNYARKKIKEDVLELEKKGTKLYSVSIIPFIIWMLSEKAKASSVPQGMEAKIFTSVNGAINATSSAIMNTTVNSTASSIMNSATSSVADSSDYAVTASTAVKTSMGLGAKLGIAAATMAAVVGVGIGVVMLGGSDDSEKDTNKKTEYSSENGKGDAIVEDSSKDEATDGDKVENDDTDTPIEILGGGNYIEERDKDGSRIFVNAYGTIKVKDEVVGTVSKGYYIYISGSDYGLKHLDGRTIIEPGTYEYMEWIDSYSQFDTSDRLIHNIILVKGKDGYGVISAEGEVIIPLEYDSIEAGETTKLDETSYYTIIGYRTNSSGGVTSTVFNQDGTKIYEAVDEKVDSSNFEQDYLLYKRKDENGNVIAWISTKSGEVLFDLVNGGIDNVFILGYGADIKYTDGSRKYVAFNEDYTSYVFISEELGNHFSVLETNGIYGFYKYFKDELDLYMNGQLAKSATSVEQAWVCQDKIYYVATSYENDNYVSSLYDIDGVVIDGNNYEICLYEPVSARYVVIRAINESTYQLYDLVNREVASTGIVSPEKIVSASDYFTLQLDDGRYVTAWKNKKVVYHDADWKVVNVCDEYIHMANADYTIHAIADLQGNVTYQYENELHQIDYVRELVLDVSGSTRAYYNFSGELVYEIEK